MTARSRRPGVTTRMRHLVPAPLRRRAARFVAGRRAADVERQLEALAHGSRPIVLGPWLGEVGFEVLYWIPFLRWFADRYGVAPERLIAVSRGGAAAWYAPFARGAYDAMAFMAADEFRRRNEQRTGDIGEQKQLQVTALEDDITARVRHGEGRDVVVLHPSLMYRLFAPYWWGHAPLAWVRSYTRYAAMPPITIPAPLPRDYTAVKFYFNDCFRSTARARQFVERTVRQLTDTGAVISLSTGINVDDHAPCEPDVAAMEGIAHLLTPANNLQIQSAIVSGARRFVGTYGGFAYLAPLWGVPCVSYYSEPGGFSVRHLDLMRDVLRSQGQERLLEVVDLNTVTA